MPAAGQDAPAAESSETPEDSPSADVAAPIDIPEAPAPEEPIAAAPVEPEAPEPEPVVAAATPSGTGCDHCHASTSGASCTCGTCSASGWAGNHLESTTGFRWLM